jgi:hypothetical protein
MKAFGLTDLLGASSNLLSLDPKMLPHNRFAFYPLLPTAAAPSMIAFGQQPLRQGPLRGDMALVNAGVGPFVAPFAPLPGIHPSPMAQTASTNAQLNLAYQTALLLAHLQQQAASEANTALSAPSMLAPTPIQTKPVMINRKRSSPIESSSSNSSPKNMRMTASSITSDSEDSSSDRGSDKKSGSLRGERRLVIAFDSLGSRGKYPQTFGKSGALIPDGVCGAHTVYNERWKFEITHGKDVFVVDKIQCVCVTWKVTNLMTSAVTSVTETRDEAIIRNTQGQTISNRVFREALEARAKDLERRAKEETNSKRLAQVEALIRSLRPKRFSEGPLIFGLQHKSVQDRMLIADDKVPVT